MSNHHLSPLNTTPPGLYRHYKGGWYSVINTVRCSETLQGMTLYRALYGEGLANQGPLGGGLWVRPAAMFNESAEFNGTYQPRFVRHDPAHVPLTDLATATALVAHLLQLAQQQGVDLDATLRPPPPLPNTCCEGGCAGCVGTSFYASVDRWRTGAINAWRTT